MFVQDKQEIELLWLQSLMQTAVMESMWLICSCNYRWYAQTYYIFHNTTFVICCWPWPAPSIYFWPYGIRQSPYDHQLKLWRYVGQEERLDVGGGILLTSLKSPQLALGGPDTYLLMMYMVSIHRACSSCKCILCWFRCLILHILVLTPTFWHEFHEL